MASGITASTAGPADNQYFYEDLVFRVDKKGRVKFGLVLENSENFSSDDEDNFDDILSKGEIRIAWHPEGREDVLKEAQVGLADRTLMPGDVVRRLVHGKDTQRGYCREINMRADLKVVGTKYIIKNVNAERLKPLVKVPRDNAVCLDSWVGSTKCVNEKIILKSSCGAIIEIPDLDVCPLKDRSTKFRNGLFAETVFYPGQVVTGRLENLENVKLLTPSISLKTNKKGKSLARKFTVQSVQIEGVWVHWQCKALSEENCDDLKANMLVQPSPYVTGEDLKRLRYLNLFESCMLQINDKNYIKILDCDVIVKKSQWEKEQTIKYKLLMSQQQKEENNQSQNRNTKGTSKACVGDKIKIKLLDVELKKQLLATKSSKSSNVVITKNVVCSNNTNTSQIENVHKSNIIPNVTTNKERERKETENNSNNSQPSVTVTTENEEQIVIQNIDDLDKLKPNSLMDDWQTDEEEDMFDVSEFSDSTGTTISTCSSPTPKSSPKRSPLLHKKQLKKLKKSSTTVNEKIPVAGEEVVTEALVVYSTATVVWQDGTVETNIPSTQLYPIHHLDDHEFFPGDFVLSGKEGADISFRDYGVIQTVDHQGRTAHVKWFTTYTSADEPNPTYTGESEVSVYDLKDHPDFQYRPGTIVIRVANFVGEDAMCTAGQIIDNYVDGRVKVWWVDGHISMCWPQDLFEVGQYDADNNFWGNNGSENDSWETESEISEPGGSPQKGVSESLLAVNLERARVAMSTLEEIFNINPSLQNQEVMRKLLAVYKKCRYLDRLMNTSFFHEDHFMGLIERVRKGQSTAERAQDQKNRLFNQSPSNKLSIANTSFSQNDELGEFGKKENSIASPREYSPKVILNLSSTPFKYVTKKKLINKDLTETSTGPSTLALIERQTSSSACGNNITSVSTNHIGQNSAAELVVTNASRIYQQQHIASSLQSNSSPENAVDPKILSNEKNILISSVMSSIDKATQETEKANNLKMNCSLASQDDSGSFSRNEFCDGSSTSYASSNDLTADVNTSLLKANDDQKSISCSSIELTDDSPEHVCARLCSLLKSQLIKAVQEIQQKYCKTVFSLSDVVEYAFPEDEENSEVDHKNQNDDSEDDKDSFTVVSPSLKALDKINDLEDEGVHVEKVLTPKFEIKSKTFSSIPSTPATEVSTPLASPVPSECFQVMETAPNTHKFHLTIFHPANPPQYYRAVRREHKLLKTSLPSGVWVRVFEDRMDLVSVMIEGPKKTPYEDGMFFFDIQLGRDYPKTPPLCHYISYCSDRLNPNLYEDGKVCVSLLGTWAGRDSEVWSSNSTLLQVIVSIQGLILVAEPYFNEAGYEKQKGTQQGRENSRMYNEMVIIKLVQSMTKLIVQPPDIFREQIYSHFIDRGKLMYDRIKSWMNFSLQTPTHSAAIATQPEFPLVPASRGFCLTLAGLLDNFFLKIELISKNKVIE